MIHDLDGESPDIDASAWVAPGAQLIGRVTLRADSSVWFNAVLRGDNERIAIGAGSNVQDGCVLHTDMGFPLEVGEACTLGHAAIVHGCVIGAGALIGMGATVLNGARIGDGALVAAGALIPEGREIPEGVLVMGRPGRVARDLAPDEIARLRRTAAGYRARAARFRAGLRPARAPAP